jgi:5-methylcytosine-specific restriction endonuclease McrA
MAYKEDLQHPQWQKKRLEIMERDGWKCCLCKCESKQLHVHHTYYDNEIALWEYDNESLVTVCYNCHKVIHKVLNKIAGLIAFEAIKNGKTFIEISRLLSKKL